MSSDAFTAGVETILAAEQEWNNTLEDQLDAVRIAAENLGKRLFAATNALTERFTAERALADDLFSDLEAAVPFVNNVDVATQIRSGLIRYREARSR